MKVEVSFLEQLAIAAGGKGGSAKADIGESFGAILEKAQAGNLEKDLSGILKQLTSELEKSGLQGEELTLLLQQLAVETADAAGSEQAWYKDIFNQDGSKAVLVKVLEGLLGEGQGRSDLIPDSFGASDFKQALIQKGIIKGENAGDQNNSRFFDALYAGKGNENSEAAVKKDMADHQSLKNIIKNGSSAGSKGESSALSGKGEEEAWYASITGKSGSRSKTPGWVQTAGGEQRNPGSDPTQAHTLFDQARGNGKANSGIENSAVSSNNAQNLASALKAGTGSSETENLSGFANAKSNAAGDSKVLQSPSLVSQEGLFQQIFAQNEGLMPGNRALPANLEGMRDNILQQIEGRLTYIRESGTTPAEMRMTLHPPELGEITIRVFSKQGQLSATILTDSALVKEILESSVSELRQRLNLVNIEFEQNDGFNLGHQSEGFDQSGANNSNRSRGLPDQRGSEAELETSGKSPPPEPSVNGSRGIDFWV